MKAMKNVKRKIKSKKYTTISNISNTPYCYNKIYTTFGLMIRVYIFMFSILSYAGK